jgi:hypothetical protein
LVAAGDTSPSDGRTHQREDDPLGHLQLDVLVVDGVDRADKATGGDDLVTDLERGEELTLALDPLLLWPHEKQPEQRKQDKDREECAHSEVPR